jgi:hypothetical protein
VGVIGGLLLRSTIQETDIGEHSLCSDLNGVTCYKVCFMLTSHHSTHSRCSEISSWSDPSPFCSHPTLTRSPSIPVDLFCRILVQDTGGLSVNSDTIHFKVIWTLSQIEVGTSNVHTVVIHASRCLLGSQDLRPFRNQ